MRKFKFGPTAGVSLALSAMVLVGCQSDGGVSGKQFTTTHALRVVDEAETYSGSAPLAKREVEISDSRARFLEKMEAFREKRALRIASFREKRTNRNTQNRVTAFGRTDETGLSVWDTYQRRTNKPSIAIKKDGKKSVEKTTVKPSGSAKGKYGTLIAKYARQHGVPYRLARAVVQVESSFRANVTGGAGEIGLMQIKLSTARGMGYKGSAKQLYDPATNLYWGMKYLGRAHQLSGGTTCGTILKYNAGHGAKRMNRISSRYCQKVRRIIT